MTKLNCTALLAIWTGVALGCSSQALNAEPSIADGGGGNDASGGAAGADAGPGLPNRLDALLGAAAAAPAELVVLYQPALTVPLSATDLAFNVARPRELWLTLRQFPSGKPCTESDQSGCAALPGFVAVLEDATGAEPKAKLKEDGNSWHFMRRPSAIAWGDAELFSTCGEARTDNYENIDVPYAGPALWSSSPTIFGVEPTAGQNGTHLDMLHETPYCMGIAHEAGNAFWVMNGDAGSLDRYDFHAPHQIGGEDHDDGEVHRYVRGELLRVPEVPSHLVYAADTGFVYVADTGHGRVLRVDPSSATPGGAIDTYERLRASGEMLGAELVELVPPGLLEQPSGLALVEDTLLITDHATSQVHAFDLEGTLLRSFDTGLPEGSLGGIVVGPDERIYLSNLLTGGVLRIEPQ